MSGPLQKQFLPLALVVALWVPSSSAAVYDAAADFSSVDNPNTVWRYGWADTLGGTFNLYTQNPNLGGLSVWSAGTNLLGGYDPVVAHNGTASPVGSSELTWEPGQLSMHPGVYTAPFDIYTQRKYSVIRWVAPNAGPFSVNAGFFGLDIPGRTGTDVHLLLNGNPLFAGDVVGYGNASQIGFASTFTLASGDSLDVVIGPGANLPPLGDYQWDTTAVNLVISDSAAPEPATLALLGLGLAGLAATRRRKQ